MVYKLVNRHFSMPYGVTCTIEVPVPDLDKDPTQAPALGQTYSEKQEKLDEFLTEMFFPQYTRAMKRGIKSYERSELPKKFLYHQQVLITPLSNFSSGFRGFYNFEQDVIGLDSDSFSIGFRYGSGSFLYGHENGHRIMFFRQNQKPNAISEIKNILSISDDKFAEEILCDAFGYLLSEDDCTNDCTRFDILADVTHIKREGLSRVALKLAWGI